MKTRILAFVMSMCLLLTALPLGLAESAPIQLVDQIGREVTLDAPAESIVSCYYITTYATMALGVSDRVVGLEKKASSRPIYQLAAPSLIKLPNVGSLKEFNLEAAAALNPDLVLMPKKLKAHADTLTDLGIAVLVVDPETQQGLEDMITLIAKACGVEDKAAALLAYHDTQLAEMAKLTAEASKPQVYLASNSTYLAVAPTGMYQSDLIAQAGGENAAASLQGDYWTDVSYETILAMNPEVIIIPCGAAYTRADVLADANMADIQAVKAGKVYEMPQGIEEWDSPIPSGVLGAMWLTSVLHEDVYPFADFQADVAAYYQTFYGFAIDTALITK